MNSFFKSQFSYCPLIWMFHSRIMNNKINRLHERCMRLIYGDKTSSFEELLDQDKSVSIHTRNLQMLATEMFKVYRSMSPPIFSELFCRRDICHNLFTKEFQFCSAKCKICFSWKRKYFLSRTKTLGHCMFGAERVNWTECLQ